MRCWGTVIETGGMGKLVCPWSFARKRRNATGKRVRLPMPPGTSPINPFAARARQTPALPTSWTINADQTSESERFAIVHHGPVIITAGVIIGVTLIFTIMSIVLGRRPKKDDEYTLNSRPASWEREGGEDLTSPMISARRAEPAPAAPATPIAFTRPAPTAVAPTPTPV